MITTILAPHKSAHSKNLLNIYSSRLETDKIQCHDLIMGLNVLVLTFLVLLLFGLHGISLVILSILSNTFPVVLLSFPSRLGTFIAFVQLTWQASSLVILATDFEFRNLTIARRRWKGLKMHGFICQMTTGTGELNHEEW